MKTGLKILLALIVLTIGGIIYLRQQASLPWRESDVRQTCKEAQVAYPTGTISHSSRYDYPGSHGGYFVFTDTHEGIQSWVKASPILKSDIPTIYSKAHQLIAVDGDEHSRLMGTSKERNYYGHELYFFYPRKEGLWFQPHTRNGIKYETGHMQPGGTIYIDWDTNTVWVEGIYD